MSEDATQYDLRLSLVSEYAAPSDKVRLLSHVMPRALTGRQDVLSQVLTVTPAPAERRTIVDFFGNTAVLIAFHAPIGGVQFDLRARVRCHAPAGQLDLSPGMAGLAAEIRGQRSLARGAPHHFTAASARVPHNAEIADFAAEATAQRETAFGKLEALGHALHGDMQFDAGSTDVNTPTAEAFERRAGVCQDFSHIMIAGLRALGIPAGYVSGFLRTEPPPGQPRLEGADAMHAWVRAWCGTEVGWVEFDPTNACFAGTDHVVVAYGRDYADVSPIQGVMMTSGAQRSHHSVDLVPR